MEHFASLYLPCRKEQKPGPGVPKVNIKQLEPIDMDPKRRSILDDETAKWKQPLLQKHFN